jgi:hypothetical protein
MKMITFKFLPTLLGLSFVLSPMACKTNESKKLLCQLDSDCSEGEACDYLSGLCVPEVEAASQYGGMTLGVGGVRGAFNCTVDWTADHQRLKGPGTYKQIKKQGVATVLVSSPLPSKNCGDSRTRERDEGKPALLDGLKTGCSVRFVQRPRRDNGELAAVVQVGFAQYETDPNLPTSGFRLNFRPEHITEAESLEASGGFASGETISLTPSVIENGALKTEGDLTARYFELCDTEDFSGRMGPSGSSGEDQESELRLRFVGTEGALTITGYESSSIDAEGNFVAGRIKGHFDIKLIALGQKGSTPFGLLCVVPTNCDDEDGCTDNELVTPACYSGECNPYPRNRAVGFCGGLCTDAQDCGFDAEKNPYAYCLVLSGREAGQCIQLCNPDATMTTCSMGSICRPGSDFANVGGSQVEMTNVTPPRCVDRCLPSPSHEPPADCPDLGVSPGDAGTGMMPDGSMMMRPDGGTPGDTGMGGGPQDTGMGGTPRDTGMGGTPRDTGMGGPQDAGVNTADSGQTGSGLGQACSLSIGCPMGWGCARQPMSTSTAGYCTKPCTGPQECTTGYTGVGMPFCGQPVRFMNMPSQVQNSCGIQCGEDLVGAAMADMCPHQMVCGDSVNNMNPTMMPPMPDGRNDYCVER